MMARKRLEPHRKIFCLTNLTSRGRVIPHLLRLLFGRFLHLRRAVYKRGSNSNVPGQEAKPHAAETGSHSVQRAPLAWPGHTEGIERIRAANLRHGFYSQADGEALRALGEDPAEFEALLESLMATWQPADEFETRLVTRLARALWRMERGHRIQESMAVRQLERLDENVERLALQAGEQYEKRVTRLKSLTAAVAPRGLFHRSRGNQTL
jgi:hypothetical protein